MFTKLSRDITSELRLAVDKAFIVDFMPFAPEAFVKVYLYGLSLAFGSEGQNADEAIARALNIDTGVVAEAFEYWQSCGIVNILSTSPVTVEYLPVSRNTLALRKFSKTKYRDFNDQLHAMFPSRNILPQEYNDYYSIMEAMHIEPSAMLAIIAYSIRKKGEGVAHPYIMAVARNLAHQGCLTYDRVNEQLSEFDLYDDDLAAVFKALGVRKTPALEDKHLFKKWTKTMAFSLETVIKVAKTVKKGGMERLNTLLTRYYENRLFSYEEIESFEKNRERLRSLAIEINRRIGVYYEQVDAIIETYITKWLALGFDDATLLTVADHCFKRNIRTLDGMNATVDKFYRKGLLSNDAIDGFIAEAMRADEEIRAVLEEAGIDRPVSSRDRDAFRTWTYTWKMPKDIIMYAAQLSRGNPGAVAYINRILSSWQAQGVTTIEQAKTAKAAFSAPKADEHTVQRTYTADQLNAIFENLDYEDL